MDSATQQGREGIGHPLPAVNYQTLDGEVRKEHVEKELLTEREKQSGHKNGKIEIITNWHCRRGSKFDSTELCAAQHRETVS